MVKWGIVIYWTSILRVLLKAIQVPHRPPKIQICNHYFTALLNKEQLDLFSTWSFSCVKAFYQLPFRYVKAQPRKVRKTNFEKRAITPGKISQPWQKSNLNCNSSNGSLLPTFIPMRERRGKKSLENEFWSKGNNSWKSESTVTKVELDM